MQAQEGDEDEEAENLDKPKEEMTDEQYGEQWQQEEGEAEELQEPSLEEFGRWKQDRFKEFAR